MAATHVTPITPPRWRCPPPAGLARNDATRTAVSPGTGIPAFSSSTPKNSTFSLRLRPKEFEILNSLANLHNKSLAELAREFIRAVMTIYPQRLIVKMNHLATRVILDDQKRAPVAWTQLAQEPICGSVVEMRKRHPTCAGQRRPLNDAVVDQCIVNDYVVTTEQMPNHGDIRRMAADQNDTILAAMDPR